MIVCYLYKYSEINSINVICRRFVFSQNKKAVATRRSDSPKLYLLHKLNLESTLGIHTFAVLDRKTVATRGLLLRVAGI